MNPEDQRARWSRVCEALSGPPSPAAEIEIRIARLVDAIWNEFGDHRPVSWVGYYRLGDGEMLLGPRRDKPACSPIGLHGACGQSAISGQSLIVDDVRVLGEHYIACDPRDLAELVVPVQDKAGKVIGVMDLDSHAVGAFGELDREALEGLVRQLEV